MNAPHPHRILWRVVALAGIGLITVVVTLGLVGWTLTRLRVERVQATHETQNLDHAVLALRDAALLGQQEIQASLADTGLPVTNPPTAMLKLMSLAADAARNQAGEMNRSDLDQLKSHVAQIADLAGRAQSWRTNYQIVSVDLQTQRTLGRARDALMQFRIAMDNLEGCRRLEDAKKFRRWWAATETEAAQLAGAILLEQSQRQSYGITDFRNQLAECARLVEVLAGEEQFDNLASLKDNQFKPVFDRMSQDIFILNATESGSNIFAAATLAHLETTIFGSGYFNDETHQSIVLGTGGLFSLRRDDLQLRRERAQLLLALADNTRNLEADVLKFTQAMHMRTATLTNKTEQGLAAGWQKLLYYGAGCSLVFLWLAWWISRDIKNQVNALEQARTAAEKSRLTTQNLMQQQQAAATNLAAAHQELQISELRFRTLSAAAPIGIFLNDAKGGLLYVNPHWLNITGLGLEQSLGKGWKTALHPDDVAGMLAARKVAIRNGWAFNYEFRFRRPSGEIRWVQARSVAIRSNTGAVTGYVGTTEDITERRKSEELLRLQEAALRSTANVVMITNRAGNIVWTNPAFTHITGYTAEEALGKNPRVLKSGKASAATYPAIYYQDLWNTISSGRVWHGEFHNSRKDGSDLIEEATITPVPDEKGEINHFVAVKQDITARKRAEAELAQAQKELIEVSRQAGMAEVATGVLHNVGNVLNSVNVSASCAADRLRKSRLINLSKAAELLRAQEADLPGFFTHDPRAKQLPNYLTQLADHLTNEQTRTLEELAGLQKHIDHIKDIVAVQQDFAKVGGVTEAVPVTALLEDALRMNASAFARHEIQIHKEFETTPVITVEKHKVLQVLVNLLNNAKQACDEAGRDNKQITLRVMSDASLVRISVADNGIGIPPENLDRVFNHGFTTRKNGHGFGLHSGANAAREMGGNLSVHSDGTSKGATFTMELPLQPPGKKHV